jgi:transposase
MDADWLASRLAEGGSIESIARDAGRSPSTVGYWVNKHGLTSRHAAKHAPRGGIDRTELEAMVVLGMPIRAIADRLGVSYTTVRHWLKKYGLITLRARRLAETAEARAAELPTVTATCPRHGVTSFGRTADGHYRCLKCRSAAVAARRRRVKERLVAAAGGRAPCAVTTARPARCTFITSTRPRRRSPSPDAASVDLSPPLRRRRRSAFCSARRVTPKSKRGSLHSQKPWPITQADGIPG